MHKACDLVLNPCVVLCQPDVWCVPVLPRATFQSMWHGEYAPCWRHKHIPSVTAVPQSSVMPPLLFCREILERNRNSVAD